MRFINLTILATVAVVFSACGGGGSSSGASGNCVDVKLAPVGVNYVLSAPGGASIEHKLVSRNGANEVWNIKLSPITTDTRTYYRSKSGNNYLESKSVSVIETIGVGKDEITYTNSPAKKIPIRYCEGDVIKQDISVNERSKTTNKNYSEITNAKVISVNKEITVPAGTFKTVYLDIDGVVNGTEMNMKQYVDQDSGIAVKSILTASGNTQTSVVSSMRKP